MHAYVCMRMCTNDDKVSTLSGMNYTDERTQSRSLLLHLIIAHADLSRLSTCVSSFRLTSTSTGRQFVQLHPIDKHVSIGGVEFNGVVWCARIFCDENCQCPFVRDVNDINVD